MSIDRATLLDIYRRLCLCREFELALVNFGTKDGASLGHPYAGQEAVAAGVCAALEDRDILLSTHRSHGHAVAKGCDLGRLALELYGSAEGTCGGRAGEMYACQPDVGYYGGTQIVAGNLAMAAGLALAARLDGSGHVTVAFVGDGGVNQGVLYESLNLAAIWSLPLVIVIEDNGYAQTTPAEYSTAGSLGTRAEGFNVAYEPVDGQDATEVYGVAAAARRRASGSGGTTIVHARTYRYEGHYFGDRHSRYRSQAEVDRWRARDPLDIHRQKLQDFGVDDAAAGEIAAEAKRNAVAAFERARRGRRVALSDLVDGVLVDLAAGELRRS